MNSSVSLVIEARNLRDKKIFGVRCDGVQEIIATFVLRESNESYTEWSIKIVYRNMNSLDNMILKCVLQLFF